VELTICGTHDHREIDCKAGKSEEPGSEATSKSKMTEIFDNDPRVLLYRTLAMQRLESELQVVDGVIDAMAINGASLSVSVRGQDLVQEG